MVTLCLSTLELAHVPLGAVFLMFGSVSSLVR